MNGLRISATPLVLIVLFLQAAQAQDPIMDRQSMRLVVEAADRSDLNLSARPELPRDLDLSVEARTNFRPMIEMSRDRTIKLPLPLDFMVSEDRETLIQMGDPLFRMHPRRLDLYWIADDGTVREEVTNQFDGNAQANLSADGFLAVAGAAFLSDIPQGEPKPKRVQLFDPRGNVLAQTNVAAELEVTQLVPMSGGQGVVYATAPGTAPLEKNQLFVLQKEDAREIDASRLGVLQKVVVLDEDRALVQGTDAYGLVDLIAGELRWVQPQRIRMVGPQAATVSQDGQHLLVMTGERLSSAAVYRWTLSILEIDTGNALGQRALDGEAPGTRERIFTQVTEDSALIRFGDEALRVSFR